MNAALRRANRDFDAYEHKRLCATCDQGQDCPGLWLLYRRWFAQFERYAADARSV